MISDTARAEIDRMSRDDLLLEANKGRASRFQRENFAYLQTRLTSLDKKDEEIYQGTQNANASESNAIARDSNKIAKWALFASLVSAVVAIVALVISLKQ